MGARAQSTINAQSEFEGVGLHSGEPCRIVLHSAPVDAGIAFRRLERASDGASTSAAQFIPAAPDMVVCSNHGTKLSNADGATIGTIEHLMAALAILSIDNVLIDVHGPEIPILDGSAALFVADLKKAGVKMQDAPRREIIIEEPLIIEHGASRIEFAPSDRSTIELSIDFGDCLIGHQSLMFDFDNPRDRERLVSARTFCRLNEVDALREAGLGRGGSLENSLVVDGHALVNEQPLRDPDEFALHKALDLIGDLYLLGAPIRGAIIAEKPGHAVNARAALALAQQEAGRHALAGAAAKAAGEDRLGVEASL